MTTARGRTDWREAGACAHADPDLFFPISSTGRALPQITKAKAICAECPVRRSCLEYALEHDLVHGIWGGTTPEDTLRGHTSICSAVLVSGQPTPIALRRADLLHLAEFAATAGCRRLRESRWRACIAGLPVSI